MKPDTIFVTVLAALSAASAPAAQVPQKSEAVAPSTASAPQKTWEGLSPFEVPMHRLATAPRPHAQLRAQAPQANGERGAALPSEPWFDSVEGRIWAGADGYKAAFDKDGMDFVPFLGSHAPRNHPARFALESLRLGDTTLEFPRVAPHREGARVAYARGSVVEAYDVRVDGVEQSFRFESLPRRGELVIRVAVDGDFEVVSDDGAHRFRCADGAFRYGRAIAIEAGGDRIPLASNWRDGAIELVVPAAFVERASLPLIVDPTIGTEQQLGSSGYELRSTDLAHNGDEQRSFCVWERVFSQQDSDVFARALDAAQQPVGSQLTIDVSTTSWRRPRIAALNDPDRFLVVAESSTGNASPFRIRGRMIHGAASPVLQAPFDVAGAGVSGSGSGDCRNPDVGGDPGLATTYFTVVWESVVTGTDHDIYFRQVEADGSLRGTGPDAIDVSLGYEREPKISKCDGQYPYASQAWAVVYRREIPLLGKGQFRAATIAWNGHLRTVNGAVTFPISGVVDASVGGYDVSSPSDHANGRSFMLTDVRLDPLDGHSWLHATAFDGSGALLSPDIWVTDLGVLGATDRPLVAIDCDGFRYGVVHGLEAAASPLDRDVRALTLTRVLGTLTVHDDATIAANLLDERDPAIVAMHSGGEGMLRYATAWTVGSTQGLNANVFARGYAGHGVLPITTRSTGCGSVGIATDAQALMGSQFDVWSTGSGVLFGFLVGAPIQTPIPGCPGCVLGVDGQVVSGTTMSLDVPCQPTLFGAVVAMQAFAVGGGSCLGSIGVSDTKDVRIQ
ncbi:MAG: hypothetical protein IT457_06990 [Planctomycetes bacterium]|nr:hypothetical protein [Planctomycetota bacterium]